MFHLVLHGLVPLVVALVGYRSRWATACAVMLATMIVDVDHLLAEPVYDPERCSIGFHPLHTAPALVVYALLTLTPLAIRARPRPRAVWAAHLVGVGLVIHMVLDGLDCAM